jgi:hypothetical protein
MSCPNRAWQQEGDTWLAARALQFRRHLVAQHQIHLPRQEQVIHSRHQVQALRVG